MRFDLAAYVEHCRVLLRDVSHALADYRVRKAGWTILYAVDFSEIYSYVMPGESHERAPMGDGWSNDTDRQFYVLSRFFGDRNILLPEPYAIELATFVDHISDKDLASQARNYLQARREAKWAIDGPLTRKLIQRLNRADVEPLTDEEIEHYFEFYEEHTPHLVEFVRGVNLPPFDRLKDLMLQNTFMPLERRYPEATQVDEERVKRRFLRLAGLRSYSAPASNVIDARALGEIEVVNRSLVSRRTRVLLVSRSPFLMRVAEDDAPDGEVFVRHPRTVSTAYLATPSGVPLADEGELQIRHQSLVAFISGAEEAQRKPRRGGATSASDMLNAIDQSTGKTLRQLLERIESEWRNVEAYATGLTKAGETRTRKGSRKELAVQLLEILRDPAKLRPRMVEHIQQIFRDVRRDRDRVAFRLQRESSSRGTIVYPIEFNDVGLRSLTNNLSAAWSSSLSDAQSLFDVAIRCDSDYDCLLGIAVSLGALGRWQLAKQYVDYALVSRPPGKRREGLFLQGVMTKRMSIDDQSLSEAQERMKDALECLDAAIREHGGVDARYYNEWASLKLWLIEFARSPEGVSRNAEDEPETEPAKVAEELEKVVPLASGKLKIQILNGLCYAYLLGDKKKSMAAALEKLKSALTSAYPDRSKWPAFAHDTVIYTTYRLERRSANARALKGWSDELSALLDQEDVTRQERRLISAHVSEIREARAGAAPK